MNVIRFKSCFWGQTRQQGIVGKQDWEHSMTASSTLLKILAIWNQMNQVPAVFEK